MLSFARKLTNEARRTLQVALETNGRGFHGFIVELPGAFVRGAKEEEAISNAPQEVRSYLTWLGLELKNPPETKIVQTNRCKLSVEDADCEILLNADRKPMKPGEIRNLAELVTYFGFSFESCMIRHVSKTGFTKPASGRPSPSSVRTIRQSEKHSTT